MTQSTSYRTSLIWTYALIMTQGRHRNPDQAERQLMYHRSLSRTLTYSYPMQHRRSHALSHTEPPIGTNMFDLLMCTMWQYQTEAPDGQWRIRTLLCKHHSHPHRLMSPNCVEKLTNQNVIMWWLHHMIFKMAVSTVDTHDLTITKKWLVVFTVKCLL